MERPAAGVAVAARHVGRHVPLERRARGPQPGARTASATRLRGHVVTGPSSRLALARPRRRRPRGDRPLLGAAGARRGRKTSATRTASTASCERIVGHGRRRGTPPRARGRSARRRARRPAARASSGAGQAKRQRRARARDRVPVGGDAGRREHAAVVGAAGARPVLVDGAAAALVEQRAAAALVVRRARTWPAGMPGAGKTSSGGTCASVSVSSGPMCTKCDVEQQAQQSPHGTSASASCRSAARMRASQAPKSPAGRSRALRSPAGRSRCCVVAAHASDVAAGEAARQPASSPSCARLQRVDVQLLHLQHRLHGPPRLLRVGVAHVLAELPRDDLPRDAEPVLEPAALLRLGVAALAESASQ